MGKSSATTNRNAQFFGVRHAQLREWGWACVLVGAALLSHLWRQAAWERRLSNLPQASTLDLMCWLESQPSPTRTLKRRIDVTEHAKDRKEPRHAKPRNPGRGETRSLSLNEASAGELMSLAGIGTVLSARIVKFRSALGGF